MGRKIRWKWVKLGTRVTVLKGEGTGEGEGGNFTDAEAGSGRTRLDGLGVDDAQLLQRGQRRNEHGWLTEQRLIAVGETMFQKVSSCSSCVQTTSS